MIRLLRVSRVRVGTCVDQEPDDVGLSVGLPMRGSGNAIGRVMEWFGAASVDSANQRTSCTELAGDVDGVGGGSNMKRRITSVSVVGNILEEE